MRIALVISSLGGGGAERVLSTLANAWASRGDAVTLITIGDPDGDAYPLAPTVRRIGLKLLRPSPNVLMAFSNNFRRRRALRHVIREVSPDLVLSFMTETNILTIWAVARLGIPVVVAERISVADHPPRGLWNRFYRLAYRRADIVVAQTETVAKWLETRLGARVRVIPNPVTGRQLVPASSCIRSERPLREGRRSLIAMGRLHRQKGFDLLIEAFAGAAGRFPEWDLLVFGEGGERENLRRLAATFGITDRVLMPGFRRNPDAVLRQADAFALSSRYEGMPNALMEAMACGLPCVSFDCPSGPGELIENEINGLLVPAGDVAGLTEALGRIMADPRLRKRLGEAARAISARYGLDAVLQQWDAVFVEAHRHRLPRGEGASDAIRESPPTVRTRSSDV